MRTNLRQLGSGTLGLCLLGFATAPAGAQNRTYLDLQASAGYSANPLLQLGSNVDSGFGRISAFGFHGWSTERTDSSLSAYVENTTYLRRFGNLQVFDLNARTQSRVSETVAVFGNVGFSGDRGAQLGSRFFGEPLQPLPIDPTRPPDAEIILNPDISAINQRQYRITSQAGASFTLSARDFLSTAVGFQRSFVSARNSGLDFNGYNATVAWQRRLNENSSFGLRFIGDHADYDGGRSFTSYGPQLTADTLLAQDLQLRGAVGFVRTDSDLGAVGGRNKGVNLALDASLCRNLRYDQLCLAAARRTQSSVIGAAPVTTSVTGSFARQLDARSNLQFSLGLSRTDAVREVALGRQTFYSAGASYDRRFTDRLAAGVNLTARKLQAFGPDPRADVGASLFIRNRFGSVR